MNISVSIMYFILALFQSNYVSYNVNEKCTLRYNKCTFYTFLIVYLRILYENLDLSKDGFKESNAAVSKLWVAAGVLGGTRNY